MASLQALILVAGVAALTWAAPCMIGAENAESCIASDSAGALEGAALAGVSLLQTELAVRTAKAAVEAHAPPMAKKAAKVVEAASTSELQLETTKIVLPYSYAQDQVKQAAPQKAKTLIFSEGIFNNTIAQFVQQELIMPKADMTGAEVDKVWYVIFTMFFSLCGCDRCCMGQCCLGTLKGVTFGGLLIWHFIDYFVCIYCALVKSEKLDMVGYDVTFKESSIQGAFIACIVILIINCLLQRNTVQSMYANYAVQQSEQVAFDRTFQQMVQQSASPSPELSRQRSVPIIEQPLGYLPTPFAKALRKAGVINKDPSTPELLAAFQAIDKDGDGKLDRNELKQALSSMGVTDADVDAMIKEADKDGDSKLSKDEFLQYHAKKAIEKATKKAKDQV